MRYQQAKEEAERNAARISDLETLLSVSQAVLSCSVSKVYHIALNDGIFANYHDLMSVQFLPQVRPGQPDWAKRRPQVEIEFVGSERHLRRMHYACLTVNGKSLPHYGECTVILREQMIAHRASVFQENSALYFDQNGPRIPLGMRCIWPNRAMLGVAKLADLVGDDADADDLADLVLHSGPTGLEDSFIEVQIFGEMTIHTFESVRLQKTVPMIKPSKKRKRTRRGMSQAAAVKDLCELSGVTFELT